MTNKVHESSLVISAAGAGYFDLTGKLSDIELRGSATVSARRVIGSRWMRKEWTSRSREIDISGYLEEMPTPLENMFDNLEDGMIAFYHEKAGRFCVGDYYLGEIEAVDDEGIYVIDGAAESDGRVYWGRLISAAAGTTTNITGFADGYVLVHIRSTNGAGTLVMRYQSGASVYTAPITNAAGLYFVQPTSTGNPIIGAHADGGIRAVEAGGIDADYSWGYAA